MIKIVLILLIVIFHIAIILGIISYVKYKLDSKDNEIMARDKVFNDYIKILKNKNLKIKELENDIKSIKTGGRNDKKN